MREGVNGNVADRTPLRLAAFRGDLRSVRRLLASGADVNARDVDGMTALMYASHEGTPP
jgi:ankyrin repeat protein